MASRFRTGILRRLQDSGRFRKEFGRREPVGACTAGCDSGLTAYSRRGKLLRNVNQESNLMITICSDLKPTKNRKAACKKSNTILRFIAANFVCNTQEFVSTLYNLLVRPHLEYNVQFW